MSKMCSGKPVTVRVYVFVCVFVVEFVCVCVCVFVCACVRDAQGVRR